MTDWGQLFIFLLSLFPLWYPQSSMICHRPGLKAQWLNHFLFLQVIAKTGLILALWCQLRRKWRLMAGVPGQLSPQNHGFELLSLPPICDTQHFIRLSDDMQELLQEAHGIYSEWSGVEQGMMVVTFSYQNKYFSFDTGISTQGFFSPCNWAIAPVIFLGFVVVAVLLL